MTGREETTTRSDSQAGSAGLEIATEENPFEAFNDDLWLDRVARWVGMGWLSRRLPGDVPPSYLYAVIMIGTIDPALSLYSYLNGLPVVYIQNPFFVLQPIALIGAVIGARSLRRRYHRVVQEMKLMERSSNPDPLVDIVPSWLPWGFFLIGAGFNFLRVLSLGGFGTVYQTSGIPGLIAWTIVNPFIWVAIAAQFLSVYLSIELIAPWRLATSDVGIDFLDPQGLGGLRPIGELTKHAYYYMVVGLIAFALVLYGPFISAPDWSPTAFTSIGFTLAWLATVATVAFAVFVLHRFMHREKRAELQRLDDALRTGINNPWDIKRYDIADEDQQDIEEIRTRMERVSATSEYPATFSIWSQLILSIILPKALQMLLATL